MDSSYLVGMRCAHEDDRPFLGHFPAAARVHFPEKELDQYRECPQKGIVDVFVHDRKGLLALLFAVSRHSEDMRLSQRRGRYVRERRLWIREHQPMSGFRESERLWCVGERARLFCKDGSGYMRVSKPLLLLLSWEVWRVQEPG
jgi:hypothetical protein